MENKNKYIYLTNNLGTDVAAEDEQFNSQFHSFILPMDVWLAPGEEAYV